MSEIKAGKITSAQHRLHWNYKRNALGGLCVAALAPMLVTTLHFQLWVAIAYGVFGLLMAFLSYDFSRSIAKTDYVSQPVVDAMSAVLAVRKAHGAHTCCGYCAWVRCTYIVLRRSDRQRRQNSSTEFVHRSGRRSYRRPAETHRHMTRLADEPKAQVESLTE